LISYANESETFPHETTADQWFSETQTESYRQLGFCTISDMTSNFCGSSIRELFEHLADNYLDKLESKSDG